MNKLFGILIICAGIALFFLGRYTKNEIVGKISTDTVMVYKTFVDTLVKPEYRIRVTTDTIKTVPDMDSLFSEAKNAWAMMSDTIHNRRIEYIAEKDTVYEDSLLYAKVSFISRLPLDPQAYFDWQFSVAYPEVHRTEITTESPSFWDSFGIGFSVNAGVNLRTGEIQPNISFGLQYRL